MGQPSNESDGLCIEMKSPVSFYGDINSVGNWLNVHCKRRNAVVCQKMQTWSLETLQKIILESRQKTKEEFEALKKKLSVIESNLVPIGFIYVQLPSQPEPKTLWQLVEWKDVTSDYAGLFFRAEGENAEPFGQLQNENSPRVVKVHRHDGQLNGTPFEISLHSSGWSEYIHTGIGYIHDGKEMYHRFEVSGGEVRPRNQAIRIWKRIK